MDEQLIDGFLIDYIINTAYEYWIVMVDSVGTITGYEWNRMDFMVTLGINDNQ